jgi:prepilin peptidase CpaA
MDSMVTIPLIVVLTTVLVGAGTDLWSFRLPNVLTIPLLLSGVVYHAALAGPGGLAGAILGTVVGGVPLLILYAAGGMGAGDVKLMAGVGAWLGPWVALHVLIVSGLALGCCSAGLMLISSRRRGVAGCSVPIVLNPTCPPERTDAERPDLIDALRRPDRRTKVIPFGALVPIGVVVTEFWIGTA